MMSPGSMLAAGTALTVLTVVAVVTTERGINRRPGVR